MAATVIGATLAGIAAGAANGWAIAAIAQAFASSLVLGAVSSALSPKPKAAAAPSFTLRDRTVTVRQPIAPRRIVYGQTRVGGALVYATCSILAGEGRDQVDGFQTGSKAPWTADFPELPQAAGRRAGDGLLFTPAHDATDGFYLARLVRPC